MRLFKIHVGLVKHLLKGLIFFVGFPFMQAQEQEHGVVVEAALTSDLAYNLSGGIKQDAVYLGNIDLTMTLDTKKLNLWKGGTFFVYLLNNHGKSLTDLVGDFQVVNNIEAQSNTRLYQIWYKQDIGNVSITIGQHDLNSEFAISELGTLFVSSSFGIQPDISSNVATSIFPVATFSGIVSWDISPKWRFINAIYDGDPGSESDNPNSLNWKFNQQEGAMTIHELQYKSIKDSIISGTYKLGFWHHTANIAHEDKEYDNTQGVYFIADKLIYSEQSDNAQGLGAFAQLGLAPKKVNPVKSYVGAGLVYTGLFPKRDEDSFGIAFGHVSFSDNYRQENPIDLIKNETVIELTYDLILNDHFSIQPDFQYVFNPSGSTSIENAFVGMVRLKLGF